MFRCVRYLATLAVEPRFAAATLISCLLVSSLHAQGERPESMVNPLAGNRQAIQAGQSLYNQNCAVCHGPSAQGDRGPSLVSGVFPHGGADGEIFLSIRAGVRGGQMPAFAQLSSDRIWQIVAFLRDLGGTGAPSASAGNERVAGDPAAGKIVFEGKGRCLDCHVVDNAGKMVGPDLSDAAKIPAERLKAKILNPNEIARA
ncbi:MAG: c-type cytochrome, partial [Bryobacteraceae bacterium]